MLLPGESQQRLCRTAAECLAAGWEAGKDDRITPAIRFRWKALGLDLLLTEMALAREPSRTAGANGAGVII